MNISYDFVIDIKKLLITNLSLFSTYKIPATNENCHSVIYLHSAINSLIGILYLRITPSFLC